MCVISACKSAIVSPYTPALQGTKNSPVLNLVHVLVVCICLTSEPQLTLGQKRRQISPSELFSTISQYICKLSIYMVTFNSERVVFCCNCMTNSLWTSTYVALYGI